MTDSRLEQALYEAECYGIGATSDTNQRVILEAAKGTLCEIEAAELTATGATEIKRLREALVLAEDVLSRAPFSTGIWPNDMHPQRGIGIIRAALKPYS